MNVSTMKHIHCTTAFVLTTAFLFCLYFFVNKRSPLLEANPFTNDPYDAVGSIAIQAAVLVSLLSYARLVRWRYDPTQNRLRLILRGNILVLAVIFITLFTDAIAEFAAPVPASFLRNLVIAELIAMFVLTLACSLVLLIVFRGLPTPPPPVGLTPADAIDDLWSLVRVPVVKSARFLPPGVLEWVKRFSSDSLFAHLPTLDPRQHPWRFTTTVGLLVGILLVLAQLQEGLPPNLAVGLLLLAVFISVELAAALLGFALLGRYLGLRPRFKQHQD